MPAKPTRLADALPGPVSLESLEPRQMLSRPKWGAVPALIEQNVAASLFPNVTGQGEVIVDIDSGVDFSHPSLAGRIWSNPNETPGDGIDNDGNGFVDDTQGWNFYDNNNDPSDALGHGTQTAGVLAADPWVYSVDGKRYQGIAPGAQILPLKVSTPPEPSVQFDQHVGAALDYTLNLVQNHPEYHIVAVNLSLAAFSLQDYQQYYQSDIQQLHDLGVFVSAAAGNAGDLNNVSLPAAGSGAFAIAGVNPDGTLSPASNRGPKVALLAPGNEVPVLDLGSKYFTSGDGTSYAAPYAAGAAALIKQVNPNLSPDDIMSVLQRSGVETFDPASNLTYRRLNLAAALALAQDLTNPPTTPFGGTAPSLPGTIQAEAYDVGGEGAAYHDTDTVNVGHRGRADGVDIERRAGGGYDVADVLAGEWLKYTVNVTTAGTYTASFSVAAKRAGGTFHMEVDGLDVTGPLTVPRTGAAQRFTTVTKAGIVLSSGTHDIKLFMDAPSPGGGAVGNFDFFQLTLPPTKSHHHTATPAIARATAAPVPPAVTPFATKATKSWLASE